MSNTLTFGLIVFAVILAGAYLAPNFKAWRYAS
jgi:hypothetical protein